jgi:hypothetical protein
MKSALAIGLCVLFIQPVIAGSETPAASQSPSIAVRLVNRGLFPVHIEMAGNPIRVGSFSHSVVGFPAGTEVRLITKGGKRRLLHVIKANDRNRDLRVN